MAIIFELVVNFGTNEEAVAAAAELVRQAGHVDVRGVPVPFGDPYITKLTRPPAYIELSVHMRGIGYGGPGPKPGLDPRSLTSDEITRTGRALYELLRSFSGYRAAVVGWNSESLVDVEDLEADWRSGDPPNYDGLVLADDLCDRWQLGPEWSAFEPGYRWLPYSGSKNLWLSLWRADRHSRHFPLDLVGEFTCALGERVVDFPLWRWSRRLSIVCLHRGHHDWCSMPIEQHPVAERPGESCGNLPGLASQRTPASGTPFADRDYGYGIARFQDRGSEVAVGLRAAREAHRQRAAVSPE